MRNDVRARLFGDAGGRTRELGDDGRIPDPAAAPSAGDPARIGRLVVIKRIGQGGMGVIYAAYDDLLDRKVAVKLLRPDGHGTGTDGRARLMREAQALARLSHPSVIQVYEVGEFEDQVYVAMEFVDGTTLKEWQQVTSRPWRDVLDAYLAAGRGLAAAHAAGIVHRDFKPDNVLVRRDGAVRVVDFGLARRDTVPAPIPAEPPQELETTLRDAALSSTGLDPTQRSTDAPLTRTGTIMGTPAYMAPEQHLGQTADARTDQFAYCVALYEALYGFRPFGGDTLPALRNNVLAGRLHAPPRYTDTPPHVLKVLTRGLQVHPDDRYPEMQQLLAELVDDPRRRLRRALLMGVGALAVLLLAWAWWSAREQRAARAEGERLRAEFERARVLNAEAELRRAQSRTVSERWDDLVLTYAREVIDTDPTRALAALKHLTPGNDGWLRSARTIAADAVQRGVIHRRLDPGVGHVERMAWARDVARLVVAGEAGRVAVWDAEEASARPLPPVGSPVRDVGISRDGTHVAAVCTDGRTHLWDLGRDEHRVLEAQDGPLAAVALAPAGDVLVTGAANGTVRIWSWEGETKRALSDHRSSIAALAIAADGSMLASGAADGTIRLWFLDRRTHWVLEGHAGGVRRVAFTDAGQLWSLGSDGVRVWSTESGKWTAVRGLEGVERLATNERGELLTAGGEAGGVVLHTATDARPLRGAATGVTALALDGSSERVAVAEGDGQVVLYRFGDASPQALRPDGTRITGLASPIVALAASPVGELIATATAQGNVRLWTESGESKATLGTHTREIVALSFSPPGFDLAGIDQDGGLIVWSITDRDVAPRVLRSRGTPRSRGFAWTPDAQAVAAADCAGQEECSVALYPADRGEPVVLPATDSPATRLRFSTGGRFLATDHARGPWLWDLRTGEGRAIDWPDDSVPGQRLALVFTADGRSLRIASAEDARDTQGHRVSSTLRVWHVRLPGAKTHLLFEEPELSRLLVDDDATTLLLRTHDDRSLLWSLDDDRMRLLPPVHGAFDRLLVAPDRSALLLRPDPERGEEDPTHLVDVDAGQSRRFPTLHDPTAWSPGGTVADVRRLRGLRTWQDPTPATVDAFLAWLDASTNVVLDASRIR